MCGRYASTRPNLQLMETFHVEADHTDKRLREDYNVAPTKTAPAILSTLPKDGSSQSRV